MAPPWNPITDMPSLQGKVAIVTGASIGIGFQVVRILCQKGAKVYATTRTSKSQQKAQEALRSHFPEISPGSVEWLRMDLADLESITKTANVLNAEAGRLDIMVNNAATGTIAKELVAARWEKHMAINVVGPFLLINRLMPLLKSTTQIPGADVRIVTMASTAPQVFLPKTFEFQFDKPSGLSSPVPYRPFQPPY